MNKDRLLSLDALRGFNMLWLIGLGGVMNALGHLFPGALGWLVPQMHHLPGGVDGFTFYDSIFPLFLFMTGASFPFSYASQVKKGLSSRKIHLRLFKRAGILVLLSFLQNGILQFGWAAYQYNSVLQRLGLTWLVTALVWMHCRPKARIVLGVLFLVGWQVALSVWGYGVADTLDSWFAPRGYFAHDLFEVHDLPLAVIQMPLCLMGMFAGEALRTARGARTAGRLALVGGVFLVLGLVLPLVGCTMNKNLATPANTLLFGGFSLCLMGLFHWSIDVRGVRFGTNFLRVIGVNSIAAYLLPSIVPFRPVVAFFFGGCASLAGPAAAALVTALGMLSVKWTVLWFLDRHDIHFKI